MRRVAVISFGLACLTGAAAHGQSMAEAGAAIAGGTVGGAAGKSVSNGVTTIFDKVNKTAGTAADDGKNAKKASRPAADPLPGAALIEAGPGLPKESSSSSAPKTTLAAKPVRKPKPAAEVDSGVVPASRWDDVPPPPALSNRAPVAAKSAPAPVALARSPVRPPPVPPPPMIVPPVTLEDLQKVTTGMTRAELLRLGQPASRITMFEGGGLLEIYSYRTRDPQFGARTLGTVRLSDGSVSDVELRR